MNCNGFLEVFENDLRSERVNQFHGKQIPVRPTNNISSKHIII